MVVTDAHDGVTLAPLTPMLWIGA